MILHRCILDALAIAPSRDLARLARYLGIRSPDRPLSMVEHAELLQAVIDRRSMIEPFEPGGTA